MLCLGLFRQLLVYFNVNTKCTVYSFPTDNDKRKEWIDALPNNTNVTAITKCMGVCQFHWVPDVPMKKNSRYSSPDVPPSIWSCDKNPHQRRNGVMVSASDCHPKDRSSIPGQDTRFHRRITGRVYLGYLCSGSPVSL